MKKVIFILFFAFLSITALYAANFKNIILNIQGSGPAEVVEGFKFALTIEANAAGYDVIEDLSMAKYYIKFSSEYDQTEQRYRFTISLVKVEDLFVIVTMEYLFADEEEMMLYSQLVFFVLMANLPEGEIAAAVPEDNSWRDKWLYARTSFDYSILFLKLKGDGLIADAGMYDGPYENPTRVAPLDNKLTPMPGIKLGAEIQFLDWMSVEPGIQFSMEEVMKNRSIYNLLFSLEVKFPLKFLGNLVLEPFGAIAYPMRFPQENEIFDNFPMLAYGGGIQMAVKAMKESAVFVEVKFLYFGDVGMKNHYGELYPKPEVIQYKHSVLGFSIGYKHGFFDRKKN
jgi:hypothetical protein